MVVEATAGYFWFVELVEPLAEGVVLANPAKLRVIAESTKKTDRLDAQTLAEFLARDMIPEAHRPALRQRQHRELVRHRQYIRGRMTSVRCKIRHILSNHNADRKDLFSERCGPAYLKQVKLSDAERFVIKQLWSEYDNHSARLLALTKKIKAFIRKAPKPEAEARKIIKTAPGVGMVTAEVVISELGDVTRFRNAKTVSALCRAGAASASNRGQEVQGFANHQRRFGPAEMGLGRSSVASGQPESEMESRVYPVEETQWSQASHRGGGPKAVMCALRDAQDIDAVQGSHHLASLH